MTCVIDRSTAFSTPWFDVVAKRTEPDGEPYYAVVEEEYVTVLAMTEERRIVLVRQYRPAIERVSLELPAGHVEKGEAPEEAARRELWEETGFTAGGVELLGRLTVDNGRIETPMWCCFAGGLADRDPSSGEPGIDVLFCEEAAFMDMIASGEFDHAPHMAVLFLARQRGLVRW